jgi:DNA-binding CsgD family transcriptional regulator
MSEPRTLNRNERIVVGLIAAGYRRDRIAELAQLSENVTRDIIGDLCETYECRMEQLPERLRGEW